MSVNSEFPEAAYRHDPYKNFRFRVKWDGKYVAGISKVSPLMRRTEVVTFVEGTDPAKPHKLPGRTEYDAITLERGVTHDPAFEQWANKVWDYHNSTSADGGGNADVSLRDFRKDIVLELYNEAGQKVLAYNIYRCWPSQFQALPELDGTGNAVAIQLLKLENEGWERDSTVVEPSEPRFTLPPD